MYSPSFASVCIVAHCILIGSCVTLWTYALSVRRHVYMRVCVTLIWVVVPWRRRPHTWAHLAHNRAQNESTALILAAEKGRVDCVRLLLEAGADKNAQDRVRASRVGCFACGGSGRVIAFARKNVIYIFFLFSVVEI